MTTNSLRMQPVEARDVWARDLRITVTTVGDAVVCALAGDLHMDNEDQVRRALSLAIARRPALLAVDLAAVTLFTCRGLNALLSARRTCLAHDVPLVLAAPSRTVLRVLEITQAGLAFTISPTLPLALRRSRGGPVTEAV